MTRKELIEHVNESNKWEQRRYEIAKDILAGFASSGGLYGESMSNDVGYAIHIADELIKQLKEVRNEEEI